MVKRMSCSHSCSKCGAPMKKIPIKRLNSKIIIEFYCEKCDESITFYTDIDEIKRGIPHLY